MPLVRRLWLGGIQRSRHQLVLRYGIDDLRLFFEGDLRFLRQFNE